MLLGPSTETARITSVLTVHTSPAATAAAGGGFVPMPVPIPTYGAATTAAEGTPHFLILFLDLGWSHSRWQSI